MGLIKPKKLKPGDTIGIVGTSSWAEPDFREAGVNGLRSLGFNVVVHPQCLSRSHGSTGTTQEKISALHDMFADASIDAIFALRGGARAIHMLDGLNYDLIAKHPKIFAGFSDVTPLLMTIFAKTGLVGFHALTTTYYGQEAAKPSIEKTLPFLMGDWQNLQWSDYPTETLRAGETTGQLVGGNMAMMLATMAADQTYMPDWAGKILVIEDVGEEIRAIDRMLGVLRLNGVFDKIVGLVIGQMTDIRDTGFVPFGMTVQDSVLEHAAAVKGPIVFNAPIGHEHPNIPFPLGVKARLTAPENGKPQLQLLESPFADA
jgi:muramoyltetrapeptide carboxypeptidase